MAHKMRQAVDNSLAIAGLVFGLSKRIDYNTLNRYMISMNECLTLDHILQQASQCLKDILNYQLFAFAVQDQNQDRLDVWIDPRIYQKPLRNVIERDFGKMSSFNTHYLSELQDEVQGQITFKEKDLLSHVIMGTDVLARMYILPKRRMLPYQEEILETIAKTLGVALTNCLNIKRLESDVAFDPLTNCYSRREFERLLAHNLSGAQRHKRDLSLIMFDLDHFKAVNDTYGHPAGDAVLKEVSATVQKVIRSEDYLARYGGEEFIIILPDTKVKKALAIAQRLRKSVASLKVRIPGGGEVSITASFGVSAFKAETTCESLIQEADAMMYHAKSMGRNQVMPRIDFLSEVENVSNSVGAIDPVAEFS
ncbi:MAG: GGDEF domain-containing protein [Deltaproteobacteria bacterium]|nr:GGDEF domain-containing protein [Deltaproteobacteria bacterium]